jgi:hypothetical protein
MKKQICMTAVAAAALLVSGCGSYETDQLARYTSISRIFSDHQGNEIYAENLYGGKKLRILGFVHSVDDGYIGYKITLTAPDAADIVYANLWPWDADGIENLRKGDMISIECSGFGTYGMSPSFSTCSDISSVNTDSIRPEIFYDKIVFAEQD